jgi:hypothetical protein
MIRIFVFNFNGQLLFVQNLILDKLEIFLWNKIPFDITCQYEKYFMMQTRVNKNN